MIVEFRSTGTQTVFPPSVHESGEQICWVDESAEPTIVDPAELLECVKRLADAVKVELGERAIPKSRKASASKSAAKSPTEAAAKGDRCSLCLAAMQRMEITDRNDGSGRLFAAACRAVEYDLSDSQAVSAIRSYAAERPFPREWSEDEILARVRDAEHICERGKALRDARAAQHPEAVLTHRLNESRAKAAAKRDRRRHRRALAKPR